MPLRDGPAVGYRAFPERTGRQAHQAARTITVGQQVFWNLIKNTVKFTPEGGEIFIRSYNRETQILVEVADTGVGVAPDILTRIFYPFEQGEPGSVRQVDGLGLGLAIPKATAEAYHGRLIAQNEGDIYS